MKVKEGTKHAVIIKLTQEETQALYEILNKSAQLPYEQASLNRESIEDVSESLWDHLYALGFRSDEA